jgi:hypothetical protein
MLRQTKAKNINIIMLEDAATKIVSTDHHSLIEVRPRLYILKCVTFVMLD